MPLYEIWWAYFYLGYPEEILDFEILQTGYFSDLIFVVATRRGPLIFLVFLQLWEGSLQYPRKISNGHENQRVSRPG